MGWFKFVSIQFCLNSRVSGVLLGSLLAFPFSAISTDPVHGEVHDVPMPLSDHSWEKTPTDPSRM